MFLVFMLLSLSMTVARYSPNYRTFLASRDGNDTTLRSGVPETVLFDAPGLIREYGYPVETHTVTTSDGYILEAHRIPSYKNNKNVVFAMHGLLGSSADFIARGPHVSLGCLLADNGYDVWLGNHRGNYYSRQHVELDPDEDNQFWDFSWEEIGIYDVAAFIDYILSVTRQEKIHYIGQSQGGTAFLVLNALQPEYNDKFISFLAMAPPAYFENNYSPFITSMSLLEGMIGMASDYTGVKEITSRRCDGEYFSVVDSILCLVINIQDSSSYVDPDLKPIVKAHNPAGASIRQFRHFAQCIRYKSFRRFNFDTATNLRLYNSKTPPHYSISSVTVPTVIFMGLSDAYVNYKDLIQLSKDLPNGVIHQVDDPKFGHSDFLWHIDGKQLLYDDMLETLQIFDDGDYSRIRNKLNTDILNEKGIFSKIYSKIKEYSYWMVKNIFYYG